MIERSCTRESAHAWANTESMNSSPFGYRKLEVWQMARALSIDIHGMTLQVLPKFEMWEEGSQVRRSIKSVRSNIVEGYGRRRHKSDYIRFLDIAYASALETVDHLECLRETNSLDQEETFATLRQRCETLCRALFGFIRGVEAHHNEAL